MTRRDLPLICDQQPSLTSDGQCMAWNHLTDERCPDSARYLITWLDGTCSESCPPHAAEAREEFQVKSMSSLTPR